MRNKRGKSDIFSKKNRGQVTIFIIIAIVIVGVIVGFLLLRGNLRIETVPPSIQPIYNNFLSCIEDKTSIGISVLGSQGGYITLPKFEAGSIYMPFSSQLDFLGNPIPYWYYVSGNNLQKEQVPSQADMEKSLEEFINEKIGNCNFDSYYEEGFEITQGKPTADASIKDNTVEINLRMDMKFNKGEDSVLVTNHKVSVASNLGSLYKSAKTIYEKEQKELFLENYGVDNLRLYAPVDGVAITCSPKTWDANEVYNNLQEAIETNTLALSTNSPTTKDGKYFFVDANIDGEARFINSRNWSNSFEVNPPSDSPIMIATPIGNQPGLGVLGFCYVPYHFVYNLRYPVLIQIQNGEEIFQFPFAVVIQGNKARTALNSNATASNLELCKYKNTLTTVRTVDSNFNPVDSRISYECFGQRCDIGETSSGELTGQFPQCVNGFIVAMADGFEEARYQHSTTYQGNAEIVLNKLYDLNVNLKLNNAGYNGKAFIYLTSEGNSQVVSYPEQKKVKLAEGDYEIAVYIYKDSSLQLQAGTSQECVNIPSSGIGGIFGLTEKKCFDVKVPSKVVSNVLAGGGKQNYTLLESSLKSSTSIEINADAFTTPTTLEQLQNNYISFDASGLEVTLR